MNKKVTILLVEDDEQLGTILKMVLVKNGFNVDWIKDGQEAYEYCCDREFDLIILDWMLPTMDGMTICKLLRQNGCTGKILMLTARDSIDDRVNGLHNGADDYLVKPFAVKELMARIESLNRRSGVYEADILKRGEYILNKKEYRLYYGQQFVELRAKEERLLEVFLRNWNLVLQKNWLIEKVWGWDASISDNNLEAHIRLLRKKISMISSENIIHTIRGVGYKAGKEDV